MTPFQEKTVNLDGKIEIIKYEIVTSSFMDRRKSHVAAGPSERLGL
jgi:hypothetical protein